MHAGCYVIEITLYYKFNTLGIVNQPQFMIIPLNTIQKYSCSGIATFINWEVNNMSIDAEQRAKGFDDTGDTILDEQISNLRTRELAVDGNSETNNSMIVCFAVLLSPPSSTFAASNSVQVLVLDNLGIDDGDAFGDVFISFFADRSESVNNLTVTHLNSTAFFISWTAPFIVEGLPIHGYNVTISNTFNGQSLTFFVENTALVYVIDNPDPNDDFTVTVFPINAVGPGEFVVIQGKLNFTQLPHSIVTSQKYYVASNIITFYVSMNWSCLPKCVSITISIPRDCMSCQ